MKKLNFLCSELSSTGGQKRYNKSLKLPIDIYGTGKELEFCQNYAEKIGISKNNLARLDSRFMG